MDLIPRRASVEPSQGSLTVAQCRHVQTACRTLRLADDVLEGCVTLADLQPFVKAQYHALAKRYHPDTQAGLLATGQAPAHLATGATFRRITEAYQWLMALPPSLSLAVEEYRLPVSTLPVIALPLVLERWPLPLGAGWQEVSPGW